LKRILSIFVLIFISAIPLAYAHPIITDSSPISNTNVSPGIDRIVINFSEAIELSYSSIKVFDNNGNQIDKKDTNYFNGDSSLVVNTPPLTDGVYTVTATVLSKVDGHLVSYAYVFGVGDVKLPQPEQKGITDIIYFPEAAARFPGIVGQVVVLGSFISSLLIWRSIRKKDLIKEDLESLEKVYHEKSSTLIGVGLFLVFASNIIMMAVQTIRLQTSAANIIETSFGSIWIVRMGLTIALLAAWFLLENKTSFSSKRRLVFLVMSLALIGTTSVIGHGAASEQLSAVVIDYVHNLLAAVWIGGIVFFGFVLIPSFTHMESDKKERLTLIAIPKFSSMILISLGILVVTGPTLLWLLEDDVSLLSKSPYGLLIIAKIAIASVMISMGGYNQFRIQKIGEKNLQGGNIAIHKKLQKSLRIEAVLGIVLLGSVALLTNTSLPSGEAPDAVAQQTNYVFRTTEFTANTMFDVSIDPLTGGANTIDVSVLDLEGKPLDDVENVKVKVSNPQKNISPIDVPVEKIDGQSKYEGKVTFGFSGKWNVEVEALRNKGSNEGVSFTVFAKPRLSQLKTEIIEYQMPVNNSGPLYPVFDGKDTLWISDTAKPRLWKFTISSKQFKSYEFEGKTSVFLKLAEDGKIWFTDTPESKIGYLDPETEQVTTIALPTKSVPISLESDLDGNMWVALVDKQALLKYSPSTGQFQEYKIPTDPSGPIALKRDQNGNIWFVESQGGKLGIIDPASGKIREYAPNELLKEPFTLYLDKDQNIWTTEHTGLSMVKFNPFLETFEKFSVSDPNALPFGLAEDKYENLWVAQHVVDKLGVYDPYKNEFAEVNIPSRGAFTQFVTADESGDIWFVEQRGGGKLGHVIISEAPYASAVKKLPLQIRYSELAAPFMTAGIVVISMFFVKSIKDKRRLDSLIP